MRVENRLDQPLPSTCVLTRHPSDPRKVISGYNNHIHSTGTIVVVDGKNYLTLVRGGSCQMTGALRHARQRVGVDTGLVVSRVHSPPVLFSGQIQHRLGTQSSLS